MMGDEKKKLSKNSLRIFLPKSIKDSENFLYGIRTETENSVKSVKIVDYYVIEARQDQHKEKSELKLLGQLKDVKYQPKIGESMFAVNFKDSTKSFNFVFNEKIKENSSAVIFYYDKDKFLRTEIENYEETSIDNHFGLTLAKQLKMNYKKQKSQSSGAFRRVATIFDFLLLKISYLLSPMFRNTVTHNHCVSWKKCLINSNHARNGFVIFDIILGVIFFFILTNIREPGKYFMDLTEIIVQNLRKLLTMLEGSPVGLKLNEQLNSFLLSCFMYHVDLWFNFIIIIEPAIHYLFLPISLIGLAGFSFQCAVICDLFTLLTLHAHCFYIYAAMLYKLELRGLRSLWRIVLGKRRNVLKNREESQEYSKNQLFLATLFFTVLLFLLPTVIIYYLVFATVSAPVDFVTFKILIQVLFTAEICHLLHDIHLEVAAT